MAIQKIRETQINQATQATITTLDFLSTTSVLKLPTGPEGDRPGSPSYGTIRFNTTADKVEVYVSDFDGDGNDGWALVGASTTNSFGEGEVIRANPSTINEDIDIPAVATDPLFENAFSKGPITITGSNTVTVGQGVTWTLW